MNELEWHSAGPTWTGSQPVIRGRSIIAALAEQGVALGLGVLYHGGAEPRSHLEPMMPTWRWTDGTDYPDSDVPVVCVAADILVPIFNAIAPRYGRRRAYHPNSNGGLDLFLDPAVGADLVRAVGYVTVVDASAFEVFDGRMPDGWPGNPTARAPEMRSPSPVTPLFSVEVTYSDLVEALASRPESHLYFWLRTAPAPTKAKRDGMFTEKAAEGIAS